MTRALGQPEFQPSFGDERLPVRFWQKVEVNAGGCWIWTGAKGRGGYGNFFFEHHYWNAHRIAYARLAEEIPHGMQLDHRCRVRECVNPAHLEVVTPRENTLRGTSPSAHQARLTHCHNGHPFGEYRMIGGKRSRRCLECMRQLDRERYEDRQRQRREKMLLGTFDRGDGYDARDPNAPEVPTCAGCDALVFDGSCADCTLVSSTFDGDLVSPATADELRQLGSKPAYARAA